MKTEKSILATLALATLFSLAFPWPDDRYRRLPSAAERTESQKAVRLRHAWGAAARWKRGYSPWMVGGDQFGGLDNYPERQTEVIGPVYVIPYYPPSLSKKRPHHSRRRPADVNPGIPPDNPIKGPYRGPSYLPPRKPTPTTSTTTSTTPKPTNSTGGVETESKFGYVDDNDRPVWGGSEAAPASGVGVVVPTRPPPPPIELGEPPLVHMLGMNPLSVGDKETSEEVPPPPSKEGPAIPTRRPPPMSNGPSNCVWAVVSCCSATSVAVTETCFEQRGCPGPFWDSGPCDSEFARAAVASALNYYNQ